MKRIGYFITPTVTPCEMQPLLLSRSIVAQNIHLA
jgi:hypothetical protein